MEFTIVQVIDGLSLNEPLERHMEYFVGFDEVPFIIWDKATVQGLLTLLAGFVGTDDYRVL